jgi:predicted HicB family RNase H-like nuclease
MRVSARQAREDRPPRKKSAMAGEPFASRAAEALRVAESMYRTMIDQLPDWVTFFREVLGLEGVAAQLFPQSEEMLAFERTLEFAQIQRMLSELRARRGEFHEQEKMITVRLPASVHSSLKAEADALGVSLNKLCITKLVQFVEEDLIPTSPKKYPK